MSRSSKTENDRPSPEDEIEEGRAGPGGADEARQDSIDRAIHSIDKAIPDGDELDDDARARIRDELLEYEDQLKKRYQGQASRKLILRERTALIERLIAREAADRERTIEDVRQEEHFLISTNLVLSVAFLVAFTAAALSVADQIEAYAEMFSTFFTTYFSWFYVLVSALGLGFLGYLALSRFGAVVLGDPDDEPEFSDLSWTAMLFSAGMGVGLLFNGAAEPLKHFLHPPIYDPQSLEAARHGMSLVCFHWGLNAWGIYTLCAVSVAYYGFRKRKKYLVSSAILDVTDIPWLRRWMKVVADLVSTLAVVFGVAASLGLGTLQIATGLEHTLGWPMTNPAGYALILGTVTVLFIMSACTGLDKGIKILSNVNMGVAVLLMIFVLLAGPTLFIFKLFVDTTGQYLSQLVALNFQIAPFTPDYEQWMGRWTLSYFTWWIAWAPFVGIFIARISRGRTIRQVIVGSLVIPTAFTIFWFATFGGAALHLEINTAQGIGTWVDNDITISLFKLLDVYPLSFLTSMTSLALILTFLVTSADSACFVISMMTTEGDLEPSIMMKVLWGAMLAVLTTILLMGGGLRAIQAAALTFAFPFSIVLILMAISVRIRLSMQVEDKRI